MELLVFLLLCISQQLVLSQAPQMCTWKCVKDEEYFKELDPNITCENMKSGVTYAVAQLDLYVRQGLDEMNVTAETTEKIERARQLLAVSNCYVTAVKHNQIGLEEMLDRSMNQKRPDYSFADELRDTIRMQAHIYQDATRLRDEVKNILDTLTSKLAKTTAAEAGPDIAKATNINEENTQTDLSGEATTPLDKRDSA